MAPRLISLSDCDDARAGGKARGLAHLLRLGLPVPPTLVLIEGGAAPLSDEIISACLRLGSPLAVRSSAEDEDGAFASFAGQFESRLGLLGEAALREAIAACLAAASDQATQAYRRDIGGGGGGALALVVQRMIEPRAAGVLFTADPVTGDRDRVVVNATAGLGEALLAGHEEAEEYHLARGGALLSQRLRSEQPLLSEGELHLLRDQALKAEAAFGAPLDLEWAIDGAGALFWLQARPITTLLGPQTDELDSPADAAALYTRCNVGEMLPGAITPLTLSLFGDAIEHGFQEMAVRIGALPAHEPGRRYLCHFSGHLFLNLGQLHAFETHILGAGRREADLNVVGRIVSDGPPLPRAPFPRRLRNGLRYIAELRGAWAGVLGIEPRIQSAQPDGPGDASARLARLLGHRPLFREMAAAHILCSAAAGALHGVLMGVLSSGQVPTAAQQAQAAALLRDIPDIESAEMAVALRDIAALLSPPKGEGQGGGAFSSLSPTDALTFLQSDNAAGAAFARFLGLHGHRSAREAELRQAGWAEDPTPLVLSLKTALRGSLSNAPAATTDPEAVYRALPLTARLLLRRVVPWARIAVARRERSKSLLVLLISRMKGACRGLAAALFTEGKLADPDLLYFLQPDELQTLAGGEGAALGRRALLRRRLLGQQMQLSFADVCTGKPQPLDLSTLPSGNEVLRGVPVCQGRAIGIARVARTPEEAADLVPGEILIVPHTDVGWTPYYGVAAGLATDTGSPLSHGAVVAREHGLPAVVNLRDATRRFRSGDRVVLDGTAGTLSKG